MLADRESQPSREAGPPTGRLVATVAEVAALPTRRRHMSEAERDEAIMLLVRYFAWHDSGRRDDRWLASGVGQCQRWDAPRVKTSAPSSQAPSPAAPADDGDVALLLAMGVFVTSHRRSSQKILRWKSIGIGEQRNGHDVPLTNEQIGNRLGHGPKKVAGLWRALLVEFINALVPGVSSGWANPARPITP